MRNLIDKYLNIEGRAFRGEISEETRARMEKVIKDQLGESIE